MHPAALLVLLGAPALAQQRVGPIRDGGSPSGASTLAARICRELSAPRAEKELPLADALADPLADRSARIASLGAGAIPVLLNVLGADTASFVDDDARALETQTGLLLEDEQVELAVAALARFDRTQLVQPMGHALTGTRSVRLRRACTRVLGQVGDRRDLKLLCNVASPLEPNGDVDPGIAPAFRTATAEILLRDFNALLALRDLLRDQPSSTRLCLYAVLADTGSTQALPVLCQRLGLDALEDPILLTEIARAARVVPLPPEIGVAEAIRPYLRSDQPVLAQAAAASLGGLADTSSVPELIELLRDADSLVREVSHASLCAITGEKLLPDPERWTAWYRAELDWLQREAPACFEQLRQGSSARKAVEISALSQHPLFRDEIALALQRLLPHESDRIRKLGLSALGQLGAASALPYLEACALDPQAEVAAEARAALERIRNRRPLP